VIPLIKGINGAKKSLEIVIFRFDHSGERNLRKLEMRLLAAGVIVARTGNDLARYHDKFMIVDRRELYVLPFNFTYLDIEHSRSFGVITKNPRLVQEAVKLFEANITRQPYMTSIANFVVSPVNARKQLSTLLRGARKELLIYDPEVSDPALIRLLEGACGRRRGHQNNREAEEQEPAAGRARAGANAPAYAHDPAG
jgi:hypothetical protein